MDAAAITSPAATDTVRPEYGNDEELLAEVMRVYRPDCTYLKSAAITETESGLVTATCEFSIPAPFYIQDTGHFNAVEFNLCYNQMMYYAVAKSVKEGLMQPFGDWTPDEYRERQLADFLIVDFKSSFRQGVRSHHFYGEIVFTALHTTTGGRNWRPMIIADTTCRYWDDFGGRCAGEVRLAVTNPPVHTEDTGGER